MDTPETNVLPPDRSGELAALAVALLDSPAEERFDRITRTLGRLLDVPIAMLNLVDQTRQWTKSAVGYDHGTQLAREDSFCAWVVDTEAPLFVSDAPDDTRFRDTALVRGDDGLRSYAGIPVRDPDGRVLASLCIADRRPRTLDDDERQVLADLAGWVEAEFERTTFAELSVKERSLREWLDDLRRRYEAILDGAGDAIMSLDPTGRVAYANPAADRLFCTPRGALLGQHLHDEYHRDDPDAPATAWADCPLHATFHQGEARAASGVHYRRADGTPLEAEFVATPLFHGEQMEGVVVLMRDIAERSAAERLQDEFISTVSHELRTPLTGILGTLSLVLGGVTGDLPSEATHLLELTQESAQRLVRLVNDILDVERLAAGRLALTRSATDTASIVTSAVTQVRPQSDAAGLHLHADTIAVPVEVDADRIVQALTNLLGNAVRFSPPDGTVRVEVEDERDAVSIHVRDEGRGIPLEAQERIFERFGQVDATDRREKAGTGLGLPIARSIAESHGGELTVHSTPGAGATFTLRLPRTDPADASRTTDPAGTTDPTGTTDGGGGR